jgi:hypothetical protein
MDNNQKIIFEAINFASFIFFFSLLSQSGEWGVVRQVGTDIAYTIYNNQTFPSWEKT